MAEKTENCSNCGLPVSIGRGNVWHANGVITASYPPHNRGTLYDVDELNNLFPAFSERIDFDITPLVVEGKRRDGKRYVENAIFVTSADTDRKDTVWTRFAASYQKRFNAEADRVSALGYDAARLVCSLVDDLGSNVSTTRFGEALSAVQGYKGVAGLISFDPARGVNREAVIMKISNKRFIRVR